MLSEHAAGAWRRVEQVHSLIMYDRHTLKSWKLVRQDTTNSVFDPKWLSQLINEQPDHRDCRRMRTQRQSHRAGVQVRVKRSRLHLPSPSISLANMQSAL